MITKIEAQKLVVWVFWRRNLRLIFLSDYQYKNCISMLKTTYCFLFKFLMYANIHYLLTRISCIIFLIKLISAVFCSILLFIFSSGEVGNTSSTTSVSSFFFVWLILSVFLDNHPAIKK